MAVVEGTHRYSLISFGASNASIVGDTTILQWGRFTGGGSRKFSKGGRARRSGGLRPWEGETKCKISVYVL